jgi:SAM-dependent methyltransferase
VPDLSDRRLVPELMDTEPAPYEDFRTCLRHLAAANRASLAYRPTLAFLGRLTGRHPPRDGLRILDAGSGYGDMLRRIAAWGAGRGIALDLVGLDLNPWSARAAAEATPPGVPVRWVAADAFDPPADLFGGRPPDVVLSALFAHHLDDAGVVRFLRTMEGTARLGWFVNDLHRARVPHAALRAVFGVLPVHRFVRHDGPVSVARAFRPADWRRYLDEAGVADARVLRAFPYRLCVERIR